MNICLVNNLYGSSARGGAEKILEQTVKSLLLRKHSVTVLCTHDKKTIKTKFENGVTIVFVPSSYSRRQKHSNLWRLASHIFGFINLTAASRYTKIFKQGTFDLVWTHNTVGFGMILFPIIAKFRQIHTFHDIQFLHPSGLLVYEKENILNTIQACVYRFLVKLYFSKNALCVFPSKWLADLHKQYGFTKYKNLVVRNQIVLSKQVPFSGAGPSFLFVGQLEPHKGVELLIKAFLGLEKSDISLWIIGTGSEEQKLRKKYESTTIKFLGRQENPLPIIAAAHCLVVPSLCYENLPTVILEAALLNTLAIGSHLGGIIEAIGDEELTFSPTENNCKEKLSYVLNNFEETKKRFKQAQEKIPLITFDESFQKISGILKITL